MAYKYNFKEIVSILNTWLVKGGKIHESWTTEMYSYRLCIYAHLVCMVPHNMYVYFGASFYQLEIIEVGI